MAISIRSETIMEASCTLVMMIVAIVRRLTIRIALRIYGQEWTSLERNLMKDCERVECCCRPGHSSIASGINL